MTKRRVPAHERPDWSTTLREIRKAFNGDLCREFVEGHDLDGTKDFPDLYCKTCGRTEIVHWLWALYEALDAAEKRLKD